MSKSGVVGFRVNGIIRAARIAHDAHPGWLGVKFARDVCEIIRHNRERYVALAKHMEVLSHKGRLPSEHEYWTCQQGHPSQCYLTLCEEHSQDAWEHLMQGWVGRLPYYLEAGLIPDNTIQITYSLGCHWGYIWDCDKDALLILKGNNEDRNKQAPYPECQADQDLLGYWGCALVGELPIDWAGELHDFLRMRGYYGPEIDPDERLLRAPLPPPPFTREQLAGTGPFARHAAMPLSLAPLASWGSCSNRHPGLCRACAL